VEEKECYNISNLKNLIDSAKREAKNSFGNDSIMIEQYVLDVRHIEIQIIEDKYVKVL